ncbi:hypothetical protein RND81_14G083400 [Saponaria officinalis]|uniref:Uncharacterized protein n=1 Tax=Saponaria officinalis TaxID=3572 RepID=A0AAW1GMP2_SAPOF
MEGRVQFDLLQVMQRDYKLSSQLLNFVAAHFLGKQVDWGGKVALIQCAKAMGIQKSVFFSIHNCDKHPEVPLMEIKYCTEKFLQDSGLNHVTIRLCGFMGLLGSMPCQY